MLELSRMIPDAEALLSMTPEELGAKIIFVLRKRTSNVIRAQQSFLFSNLIGELWPELWPHNRSGQSPYPRNLQSEINLALAEAWAWLVAQGLLVPAPGASQGDWRVLSRRALRFESETEVAQFAVARMLPKEVLHPRISDKVWSAFMRNEFDVAVFQAMKGVEVAVREATNLQELLGMPLMWKAFNPENGRLTDMEAQKGEREARSALFAGAIGSYKNPHSHRDIEIDDPVEAIEIIMLANHLLRIVDARTKANESGLLGAAESTANGKYTTSE